MEYAKSLGNLSRASFIDGIVIIDGLFEGEQGWVGSVEKRNQEGILHKVISADPTDVRFRILPTAVFWSIVELKIFEEI